MIRRLRYLPILVLLLFCTNLLAQNVLMEENISDYKKILRGPNRTLFGHFYVEYGFIAQDSEGEGMPIEYGLSHNFTTGYRYKLKLRKWYDVGLETNYTYQTFHLKQSSPQKFLPTTQLFREEAIRFNSIQIEVFNRLNIGHAGNKIGNFVDLGYYASYSFRNRLYRKDKSADNQFEANTVETFYKGINFVNRAHYGLRARLGVNKYVVVATYRLSDLVSGYDVELPRLSIGLQLGLHP